ncbi:MAG: SDR family oxidoreductase [Deltaproteobacteria bacterium]|nr:SDR family oxidoreductase [Deltaproteobacteria bacterium]
MKDKTVVITGATSGLGRATALQLAQKGAFVVIIARSNTKANEVIKEIKKEGGKAQFIIYDLSSMKDTKEAAESITKVVDRLDVLINNAGAYFPEYRETSEGFESTLALNYLSSFLLTHHLIEQMERTASEYGEARIINISSTMHKCPINWDDLNYKETTYNSSSAYYQSKHLLTSFTYYLSRKLRETGITANCIHPGFVKTALAHSDFPFPMKVIVPIVALLIGEIPEQAADTPVWLALSDEVKGLNGEYVHHRKIKKSWLPTRDENAQKRLYNVTQSMLDEWL